MGCLIILGLFLYLPKYISTTSTPIYEEIYSTISDLNQKIGEIDDTLYEALYQGGIAEKNILFPEVTSKYEKGYSWDFTELLINLSEGEAVLQLKGTFNSELSKLGPIIRYDESKVSDREIVFQVFALGFYTHKIRLIQKEHVGSGSKGLPKIAIIIDDLGYDRDMDISFIHFDLPLSLSVLPFAPYTEFIAYEAKRKGRELLLHLPMEPKGYPRLDPGPGALLTDMDEKTIRQAVGDLVRQVPGLRGVNHHMGSCFSERSDKMTVVLDEIQKRNLFYVDSRTTPKTVVYKLAKTMGVPVTKKSVFLDHDLSPKAIRFQVERLLGIARYSGMAVGIGHPHKETLKVLEEYHDQLIKEFKVVPVSELAR